MRPTHDQNDLSKIGDFVTKLSHYVFPNIKEKPLQKTEYIFLE